MRGVPPSCNQNLVTLWLHQTLHNISNFHICVPISYQCSQNFFLWSPFRDYSTILNKFMLLTHPSHPNISMHILHTVLYTFPMVLTRRLCVIITSVFGWWSFLWSMWPKCVIQVFNLWNNLLKRHLSNTTCITCRSKLNTNHICDIWISSIFQKLLNNIQLALTGSKWECRLSSWTAWCGICTTLEQHRYSCFLQQ